MIKRISLLLALLATALGVAGVAPAGAQTVERPVPFDSVGRVTALTPAMARRLGLAPPTWTVTGPWTEARLYEAGGRITLVVRREDGSIERRELSADELSALRAAVSAGMQTGVRRAEDPEQASRPARGAFIRDQLILSAVLYAPSLAELTDDESAGVAVYLLATGGAFFTAAAVANDINVSRAQQFLTRDAAIRGTFAARGIAHVIGVDPDRSADDDQEQNLFAISSLLGGIGGSVIGFNYAKPLTDGEARSAALTSTTLAATVLGVAGTAGLLDDPSKGTERGVVAATVAAGLTGYPIGTSLARRAGFTLTGGDARATRLGGLLGVAAGLTLASAFWDGGDASDEQAITFGLMTAGGLAGLFLGDRTGARPFDYTEGEAFLVELGAGAGGLMGVALPVLAGSDEPLAFTASATAGAVLGAVAAHNLVRPRRAMPRSSSIELPVRVGAAAQRPRASFSLESAAMAAVGMRGRHSILSVSF